MDWIFFGDDFGAHPSTTQHLAMNLPEGDRIVWVNSLGMRSPGLNRKDFGRVIDKAKSMFAKDASPSPTAQRPSRLKAVVNPKVLPFHKHEQVRKINRAAVTASLGPAMQQHQLKEPVVVAANPVAVYYLPQSVGPVAYLRLDDYGLLPGVDRELVEMCEQLMIERADLVFATAKSLLAGGNGASKSVYLEQGVDWGHFAGSVRAADTETRVLGFFGLLAEWVDYELILSCAQRLEDWKFVLVGPVRQIDPRLESQHNIELVGSVPYEKLPDVIAGWHAAWVPFAVNTLTKSVNPIKLRESLAAGLPTLVTPLPEADGFGADVQVVSSSQEVSDALDLILEHDSLKLRKKRSRTVQSSGWTERAGRMRQTVCELGKR